MELTGSEQREHFVSRLEEGIFWEILIFVGMMFQTIFHKKTILNDGLG
jgi:hypothetical protein